MSLIDQIRKAVQDGQYAFTDHAVEEAQVEEAQNDELLLSEVVEVLLTGEIDSIYSDDPRGTRYVVRGDIDEAEVDVVCRFNADGKLLIIITVYVVN